MERIVRLDWQALVEEAVSRRKLQKISQEKFAQLCGISKPTLSHFEQGKQQISVENAFKILKMLGMAR